MSKGEKKGDDPKNVFESTLSRLYMMMQDQIGKSNVLVLNVIIVNKNGLVEKVQR